MDPAAPSDPPSDHYVVRLSGALATLLGGAEGAESSEGAELFEDELLDGLRAAGLLTYESPPAAHATTFAAHHPDAAAAVVDVEGAPDELRVAGLLTHQSPPTTQHPAPAAQAAASAAQPLAAAAAADADDDVDAEGAPVRRVLHLAGAVAALLGHAEGAVVTEDEAGEVVQLMRTSTRPTLNTFSGQEWP
jgi:hypothetical protein